VKAADTSRSELDIFFKNSLLLIVLFVFYYFYVGVNWFFQ